MQAAQSSLLARLAVLAIAVYRNSLSIIMLDACRCIPSCSRYAQAAISKYGFRSGCRMTLGRLLRCQPFSRRFVDPVI